MTRCTFGFFLLLTTVIHAQPTAQFSFSDEPYSVCQNESILISNSSTGATSYTWDFCPEEFNETPSSINLTSANALQAGAGYKIIRHLDKWFGFLVSRSTNKLLRLDFSADPSSIPTITDLGNPGGFLNSPEGIDIYNHNGNWYGFVGYNGDIVRLDFGASIDNSSPVATRLNQGSKRFADVKVVNQDNVLVLLAVVTQDNTVRTLNFGSSFLNAPTSADISVSSVEFPLGISVIKSAGNWIAHLTSYIQNGVNKFSITQLNFGPDILAPPVNEARYSLSGVEKPYRIKLTLSGGEWFAFVSNELSKMAVVNLHDLNPATDPTVIATPSLPTCIAFDVTRYKGKTLLQVNDAATNSLRLFSYDRNCAVSTTWTEEQNPKGIRFFAAGPHLIDLIVSNNYYDISTMSGLVTVRSSAATDLVISNSGICQNSKVDFGINTTADNISWSWDFGNGEIASEEDPSTIYAVAGTYRVTIAALDNNSCHAYDTLMLNIYEPPSAAFNVPLELICTNNNLTFHATTPDVYNGNLQYQWFVDDVPSGTQRNLEYIFTTGGEKELKFRTSIPGCSDEATKTIGSVEIGPVVDFSFTGTCEDDDFSFQSSVAGGAESYVWDFGEGAQSHDPNPTHLFADGGNYSVSLTANNAIGCETTKHKTVSVHSKPVVDFHAEGPPNACSGSLTSFVNETVNPDGRSITSWLWDFDDGNDTDNRADGQHTFAKTGTYKVSLTATTEGACVGMAEIETVIFPSPSTAYTASSACEDVPVTFTVPDASDVEAYWEIGTSYYDGDSPKHTFAAPGNYPLYLEVRGANGCMASRRETFHIVTALIPDFTVIRNCVGENTVITDITSGADPVTSRRWDFSTGESFDVSPLNFVFQQEGTPLITLTVETQAGCKYAISKKVQIVTPPTAGFSASPASGAYPMEVTFSNTSSNATQFFWQFQDGSGKTSTEPSPSHTFATAGTFNVHLTASNAQQCQASFSSTVTTVDPLPDVDIEMISIASNSDGSAKLIITLHNKGNTVANGLPLDIDIDGNVALRQILPDPILPNSKLNFIMNTGIANPDRLRYLCVSVQLDEDLHPAGNRMCKEFENRLVAFPVFPNPTSQNLHIEWISDNSKTLTISLIDRMGRSVFSKAVEAAQGLNTQVMSLTGLDDGLYFLIIDDAGSRYTQRVLIMNRP